MMTTMEAQEIHCHNCNRYVRFQIDLALDGNHVLKCPKCGHEHCRVVSNGKVTDDRWDSRNGYTYQVTGATWATTTVTTSGDYFLGSAWLNATTSTGWT